MDNSDNEIWKVIRNACLMTVVNIITAVAVWVVLSHFVTGIERWCLGCVILGMFFHSIMIKPYWVFNLLRTGLSNLYFAFLE